MLGNGARSVEDSPDDNFVAAWSRQGASVAVEIEDIIRKEIRQRDRAQKIRFLAFYLNCWELFYNMSESRVIPLLQLFHVT